MYRQKYSYKKKTFALLSCIFLSVSFTGCGPSEEKISQAQDTYVHLTELHNQVVEAHSQINDNSLDKDLVALSEKVKLIEEYNLNEMKDEQIDLLIETMDSMTDSYQEYLETINTIKAREDAAVLTPIPVSLQNSTEIAFQALEFYSEASSDPKANILENTGGFEQGQFLTGLVIYRDVDSTPWILKLEDTEGKAYKIELPVAEYDENGVSLVLSYDPEQNGLICS